MKNVIAFITGTSGAGKTTLVNELKKMDLNKIRTYDFDEGGVPEGADENWRKQRTEEWLKKAINNINEGSSTIICGVCVPEEIKECSNYSEKLNVYYGFIHINEDEIIKRLSQRGWNENLIRDNVNWAKRLEMNVKKERQSIILDGSQTPINIAKNLVKFLDIEKNKKEIVFGGY